VALLDDRAFFQEATISLLARAAPEMRVVAYANLVELERALEAGDRTDLVLMFLYPERLAVLTRLCRYARDTKKVPVAVLIDAENPELVRRAMDLGASGLMPTSFAGQMLADALRLVAGGGTYVPTSMLRAFESGNRPLSAEEAPAGGPLDGLTPRQREVVSAMGRGLSNRDIATELKMSEATVKVHAKEIMKRLGVTNRTQAALVALGMPGAPVNSTGRRRRPPAALETSETE
jgi:DNA-binding NarL/FixJ family response regulator